MKNQTENKTTETQTETKPKTPTALDAIRARGAKDLDDKTRKQIVTTFSNAMQALAEAQKAADEATENVDRCVAALAEMTGGSPISFRGQVYTFGCRGTRIFLKQASQTAPVEL